MTTSFLRQTLRILFRQRTFTLIHIFGLAIGLAACSIIGIFIAEELSFDTFHPDVDTLHRILLDSPSGNGDSQRVPFAVATLGPAMVDRFPAVTNQARVFGVFDWSVNVEGEACEVESLVAADPSLLTMFGFDFIEGNPARCLRSPNEVVLNRSTAQKLFRTESAVGKLITFDGNRTMKVTGVFEDFPETTHLALDMILPIQLFTSDPDWAWINEWYTSTITYVTVQQGTDVSSLSPDLNSLVQELLPDHNGIQMELQPVRDIHLHSSGIMWDYAFHTSQASYLYLFGSVGIGILLLAIANFMNLATSRSLLRAGEVGIRKVVGATKRQLIGQFLLEAVVIALLALPLALLLVDISLPYLRPIADRALVNPFFNFGWPIALLFLATTCIGLVAGSYPSLVISHYSPLRSLRSLGRTGRKGHRVRRVLVVFQFVLSTLLLLSTGAILYQVHYLEATPLGFTKDQVVSVRLTDESNKTDYLPLRDEIIADPGVISACMSQVVPGVYTAEDHVIPEGWQGEDRITINMNIVCDRFVQTMGLEMVEGRDFDPSRPADDKSILLNEAALKAFGWETATGKTVTGASGRVFPVTGVVRDYHFKSLHDPIQPQMLVYYPVRGEYMNIHLRDGMINETLNRLEGIWQRTLPDRPFSYFFIDEALDRWYSSEKRLSHLLTLFGGLALIISCLGILGLASHAVQQRRSEIGIRKVLGASVRQIFVTFVGEFLLLVGIANVLSWPAAALIGHHWVQDFAYQAPAPLWMFVAVTIGTFFLVLLVSGGLTWRAATTNPADAIRDE